VTWDEGADDRGCCGVVSGGRMATVVAGPDVKQGAVASATSYSHYSILRTIEEAFGLPLLRKAGHPRTLAMGSLLKRSHRGAMRKPAR
jgi:phosphatidylinositol-3-phosphatase